MLEKALNDPDFANRILRQMGQPRLGLAEQQLMQQKMVSGDERQIQEAQEMLLKRIPDLANAMGPLETATKDLRREFRELMADVGHELVPVAVQLAHALTDVIKWAHRLTGDTSGERIDRIVADMEKKFPNVADRVKVARGEMPGVQARIDSMEKALPILRAEAARARGDVQGGDFQNKRAAALMRNREELLEAKAYLGRGRPKDVAQGLDRWLASAKEQRQALKQVIDNAGMNPAARADRMGPTHFQSFNQSWKHITEVLTQQHDPKQILPQQQLEQPKKLVELFGNVARLLGAQDQNVNKWILGLQGKWTPREARALKDVGGVLGGVGLAGMAH